MMPSKENICSYRELHGGTPRQRAEVGWQHSVKRACDFTVALCGLLFVLPLLLAVGLVVWVTMGRPILFRQRRPGLHAKPFVLCKFRTMSNKCNTAGEPLPDTMRLTSAGRIIRSLSLDELPQLWNVLRGEMSLVGPRPLLMQYLGRYSVKQARRHEVLPGITGWAQINGRNALSWEQKFDLDVWYVDHQSIWLDIRILWLTIARVLRRDGINQAGALSMPEFLGPGPEDGKSDDAKLAFKVLRGDGVEQSNKVLGQ